MSRTIIVTAAAFLLISCASTSTFKEYATVDTVTQSPTSVAMDAEQRAIIAVPVAYKERLEEGNEGARVRPSVIVCAEPSPDVVSELQTGIGLSAAIDDESRLAFAQLLLDKATEIGERNATIQLLRDGLYRQCEAYMNGVITYSDYKQISNRYVDAMVTLLAIERLTASSANRVTSPSTPNVDLTVDLDDVTVSSEGKQSEENGKSKGGVQQLQPIGSSATDVSTGDSVSRIAAMFLNKNIVDTCLKHREDLAKNAEPVAGAILRHLNEIRVQKGSLIELRDELKELTTSVGNKAAVASEESKTAASFVRNIEADNEIHKQIMQETIESLAAVERGHKSITEEVGRLIDEIEAIAGLEVVYEYDPGEAADGAVVASGDVTDVLKSFDEVTMRLASLSKSMQEVKTMHEGFFNSVMEIRQPLSKAHNNLADAGKEFVLAATEFGTSSDAYNRKLNDTIEDVASEEQEREKLSVQAQRLEEQLDDYIAVCGGMLGLIGKVS